MRMQTLPISPSSEVPEIAPDLTGSSFAVQTSKSKLILLIVSYYLPFLYAARTSSPQQFSIIFNLGPSHEPLYLQVENEKMFCEIEIVRNRSRDQRDFRIIDDFSFSKVLIRVGYLDSNFESKLFKEIVELLEICKTKTTALHLLSNSDMKHQHGIRIDYLTKFLNQRQRACDRWISYIYWPIDLI
uniref:Uncharacterized protein n=1 Tax=Vespula pensylvanica TaxID=30213 RepID=A0A834JRX6_VESPE|nr:hypothetical protein H0235_017485 [Vespula pensylvanica]